MQQSTHQRPVYGAPITVLLSGSGLIREVARVAGIAVNLLFNADCRVCIRRCLRRTISACQRAILRGVQKVKMWN